MSRINQLRGSEWRKWDLHVHTPNTKLSDNFNNEGETDIWKEYCDRIENSDVEVFGITDYFCAENYFTFLTMHKKYYPGSQKVFFPNIELRLEVSVNKKAEEVNIHVIFSNTVSKSKIEEFLLKLSTNITNNGAPVSCKNLSKQEYEGAAVSYSSIRAKLFEVFGKECSYVIITAANNAGLRPDTQSPRKLNITDEIDKISDGFFGGHQNVEYYLKTDRYETTEVAKPKPVISGCDGHSFVDLDNYLGKRFLTTNSKQEIEVVKDITWVKAEPKFEGLQQILNEPSRVFIGEIPPVLKRVDANPTKYIKSIQIDKVAGSPINDIWFDGFKISLNPELVAIIGNKGKGKSALSDILGLCANAHIEESDFSFLHKDKFRNRRSNFAKEFNATLNWEGGTPDIKNLDFPPNVDSPERVKYIPQSFLEKLCTSIDKKIFEEELEKVIFSRLEDFQKLNKGTLKEVLSEKKLSLENQITQIKNEISLKNSTIVELERKNSAQYRSSISEALQAKENELNVHLGKEPIKRDAPEESDEAKKKSKASTIQINSLRETIKIQQGIKEELTRERNKLAIEINELSNLDKIFKALSEYVKSSITNNGELLKRYSLKDSDIVSFSVDTSSILQILEDRINRQNDIEKVFEQSNVSNPDSIILNAENSIKKLQDELEGESKEYQQYLSSLQDWHKQKQDIIGAGDKEGSLTYYKEIKNYLESKVEIEINEANEKRKAQLRQLLNVKKSIADLYKELYKPVSEFITLNKNELSDYNVNIDVSLEINDFDGKFFNYISNGAAGSFYGSIESRQMLGKITEVVNFNDTDAVIAWVENILDYLRFDKRDGQNQKLKKDLKSQLKGGFKEKDFYDFLFYIDYYEPNYQLKLGNKNLSELSPGERGALLLIFYLLLDKRDIPIIIDQPEENLDNQSVYKILVHFIKKAKERRQIIIVTHNPNLAVVCDAEQVIRMDIAKDDKNKVSMITGGIENSEINKAIVDILEGTRPAFNNRTFKYEVSNLK